MEKNNTLMLLRRERPYKYRKVENKRENSTSGYLYRNIYSQKSWHKNSCSCFTHTIYSGKQFTSPPTRKQIKNYACIMEHFQR
jgi:hypothetical protein